jgi:aryl-alcohol dehydrogenase-like predicted oxidoreductase
VHSPDQLTPIDETLRTLDDLIRQGKVRYIGCSNFPAWQVVEAQWTARANGLNAFVSCQDEYLLLKCDPEPQLLPAMRKYGLGLHTAATPRSPPAPALSRTSASPAAS